MPETVNLRGHHLLCILTHSGSGYTADFVDNLGAQIANINNGAESKIVSGPDDICAALLKEAAASCDHARVCARGNVTRAHDLLALQDVSHELRIPILKEGDRLKLGKSEVASLREAFADGSLRRACAGCPWYKACSEVAGKNFTGVKLLPNAVPNPLHRQRRAYGRSSLDR